MMFDAYGNHLWTNTTAAQYPANDVVFYPNFDNTTYFGTGTYIPLDPNPYQMAIVSSMPQPAISSQPVLLQTRQPAPLQNTHSMSNSAEGSVNGKYEGRKRMPSRR